MKAGAKSKGRRTATARPSKSGAAALRECEARFEELLRTSQVIYWEQDENYRYTCLRGGLLETLSIAPAAYLGTKRWDHGALPAADDDRTWAGHRAALEARQPFQDFLLKHTTPDGDLRFILASGQPVFDRRGRFRGYRGVSRDVTESRRADALLKLEHGVARCLSEAGSAPEAMQEIMRAVCEAQDWELGRYFVVDPAAGVLRLGGAWVAAGGEAVERHVRQWADVTYAPGVGLIGLAWQTQEAQWAADLGTDPRAARRTVATETGMRGSFVFPVGWAGRVIGVFVFNSREVRKPDERLLDAVKTIGSQIGQFMVRQSAEEDQRRFRAAMDASADLMLLVDPDAMRYIDANAAACRALGYSREELLALGPQDIFSSSKEELQDIYRRMRAGEEDAPNVEGCYRRKDGSVLAVESSRRAVRTARGDVVVAIARDIGARKREEELLRLEHAVTRCIAEAADSATAVKEVIRAICESEQWECGDYWWLDERRGVRRLLYSWGVEDSAIQHFLERSRGMVLPAAEGNVGRVIASGRAFWKTDMQSDTIGARALLARQAGLHALFVLPILAGGKPFAAISFNSRQPREPDERFLQAAQVIGSQVGQFLQRKQAEEVLRESEERFRGLTQLSSDMYWEQDDEFRFTRFEGIGSGRLSQASASYIGKKRWEQQYTNMSPQDWEEHISLLEARRPFRDLELCRLDEAGSKVWISISGEPVFDSAGAFRGYRGVGKDITDRKLDEERIRYLATHDALTSLPNRSMFSSLLGLTLENARRYERSFAVLFVDLDRFKTINDTLGHEAGDRLLKEMAGRLVQSVRASDVVARLGGDEFVVLVQEVGEAAQAEAVARKILSALMRPLSIDGQDFRVTASIGICMYPSDAQDEQAMMKNADIAMYQAKEEGKNTFKFYSPDSDLRAFERMALERALRTALERNELQLHYQAKLDLHDARITGVEALLRWQHPELGAVTPGQFIPLAEETGLIVPIGRWVLQTACAQNVAWQREGLPPLRMAVNISARQFADESLLGDIAGVLQQTGMRPELLELELTESMVMQNPERAGKILAAVKAIGVRLAIDDFGVGYSSLTQLKRFPIDTLKVDRSFIRDIPQDAEDRAITEAIIAMGKSLKLTVVAEGVETLEQQTFLQEHACDEIQGYFFSRPVPPEQLAALLRRRTSAAADERQELLPRG